jgi:hypothetical protein
MATLEALIAYIREGNEQAVKAYQLDGDRRWAGKSHAYDDVLAFIENEMLQSIQK